MEHLTIIGTSHIAPQSVKKVERTIREYQPFIVAVELDKKRYVSLLSGSKDRASFMAMIRRVGMTGALFALIGHWIQQKLSDKTGMIPGSDMLAAVKTASSIGSKVVLIDQDIEITLKKLSRQFTFWEKLKIIFDIIKGLIVRDELLRFDLNKVPPQELIKKLIDSIRLRYPGLYDVLIHQRDKVMSRNLARIMKNHPGKTIIAVVGAGHEDGMTILVKKYLKSDIV